jgi:hypothetical protein
MRGAVRLLPVLVGLSALPNCMPREDVDGYSAGLRTDAPGLQPSAPAPESPAAELAPPAEPSQTSDNPSEPPEIAAPSEGAPQPSGLAPGEMQAAPAAAEPPTAPETPEPGATPPAEPPSEPPPDPETEQPPSAAPPTFRFVRLIADSDITLGPLTSIAELGVLGSDGQPLAREGWLASADSAEQVWVGGAPASMAIDGDAATMWHTPWFEVEPPPHPHFLVIDLGGPRQVGGFRYQARQDGVLYGSVAQFRFFVSVDGVDWGDPVAAGTLADSAFPQDVRLVP